MIYFIRHAELKYNIIGNELKLSWVLTTLKNSNNLPASSAKTI